MPSSRLSALGLAAVAAAAAAIATGASGHAAGGSIHLTKSVPSTVRVKDIVTVTGHARAVPSGSEAALQLEQMNVWSSVAHSAIGKRGFFKLGWRVKATPYSMALWRVVAMKTGRLLASTAPVQVGIGPAAVYCDPPPPPEGKLPIGQGWVVGGEYGEGGAYPGIYACSDRRYSVSAVNSHGHVLSREVNIAPLHSYRFRLPAAVYTLTDGVCTGQATVIAGKQVTANTYCRYP